MDNMAEQQKETSQRKNKKLTVLVLILLLLLGVAAGMYYRLMQNRNMDRLARDAMALGGMLPGKTPQEIEDLLNEKVAEGMINIGIAARPVFEENGKRGRVGIENIAANNYSFQITITLDDTGEVIYESGLVDPGYYIEFAELKRTLQAGNYPATARFVTYSLDESEDKIAETHVKLVLYVMDGKFY